jgi:predicted metal-dependent phosphoesterase TrpH
MIAPMRIELHCHTTASDGRLTPTQLLELARDRDIRALAITDHDTVSGHDEACAAGERFGVRVIPGIEISSLFENKEVHVLGYGVRPTDARTLGVIESLQQVRVSRAKAILARLDALGVPVAFERVARMAGDGMIGRPHIARALLEAGHVPAFQDAFDSYLAEGAPAFVANDALSPAEAVALIHAAHGCAVMAHPALFRGDLDALFEHMLAAGVDGVVVYHLDNPFGARPGYLARVERHKLLATGGSDFHAFGGDNEAILGSISLPADTLQKLDARMSQYA